MTKAIFFFVITAILWALAIASGVRGFRAIVGKVSNNFVVMEAPGRATFAVEEAGTMTLWHNYQDFYHGTTVVHDPALPAGFSFELRPAGSATVVVPLTTTGMNTTMRSGSTSKSAIGTFAVTSPGDYELIVSAPASESRVVSLSTGTPMGEFGKIFGRIGGAIALGLGGMVTLVLAIVFLFLSPKPKPSTLTYAA